MDIPTSRRPVTMDRLRRLRPVLVAVCALPIILACGMTVTHLSSAPASSLQIEARFDGALVPGSQVTVRLTISSERGYCLAFTNHQFFSVNGVRVPEPQPCGGLRDVTVPRQPPGGSYDFVYTDERGQQTTFVVPAPSADFVVTSPAPKAHVRLPVPSDQLTVRYTVPFPLSAFPPIPPGALPPLHYTEDDIFASAYGACNTGTFPPPCGETADSGRQPATGSVTIADVRFQDIYPGPGTIVVGASVSWFLPTNVGFASAQVVFGDPVSVPVLWVK